MKKLLILIVSVLVIQNVQSQEEAIYRQYFMNPMTVNPATVGQDREHHDLFMNLRSSFASFSGAPKTYSLSYNGPVGKQIGIGGMVFTENIADITRFRAQMAYSMGIDINEVKIRAGLSLEYQRMSVSNNVLSSELIDIDDDVLAKHVDGDGFFDTSMGILAEYKNFYFGYAAPNLIRTVTDNISTGEDKSNFSYFLFHVGGKFELPGSKIKLEPSIILRNLRDVDTHVDVNLLASFLDEQLITGLLYRGGLDNSVGFLLGTKYNTIKFVYSYDVLFGDFQKYNSGSHEITIGFEFGRKEGKFDRSRKYREQ